jgi:FAD/FMN-containing dehydrogenase
VQASATSNPDLFWALRGGSGNFGVVTSFEFRLHKVGPDLLSGLVVYPLAEAKSVLKQYRDFVAKAPEDLSVWTVLRKAPPLPFLPAAVHGKEVVVLALLYAGDAREGEVAVQPLRKFGKPLGEHVGVQPYNRLAEGLRSAAHGRRAQLLEVAQLHEDRRRPDRPRHRVRREAAVAPLRDLLRFHRRGHEAPEARRHGLRPPRRRVRHERPRPLGDAGRGRALHPVVRATTSRPPRPSPAPAPT